MVNARSPRQPLILNVNDNEGARYLVTQVLKKAGFEVVEAGSGTQALAAVEARAPNVMVLDLRLPDMTGFDVCRRIRENPRTEPIKILHTSATYVTTEHRIQSLNEGSDGYLVQPFEPEELVATVRALLRLNEAELELRRNAEQLREADRRKDEFLAMLGHELRNPLAAITASLPLLDRREPHDDVERRSRDVLHRQAGHLGRLVDDLLDVARVTQGKIDLQREPVDLGALITRVAENIQNTRTRPRRQALLVAVPGSPLTVRGDASRLEQILVNLLDNASKYSADGGTVQIVLSTVYRGGEPTARVLVRDDGVGMATATLPTIFGLFAQGDRPLDRAAGGLGIGLTLVRSLVELHGGTITARSEGPGKGSEFEVELPVLADEDAPETAAAMSEPGAPPVASSPCRMLIVEDSVDVQDMMRELIAMWGHEVLCASDGTSGVTTALEGQPHGAFVDIGLPGIDGYEVARRIRSDPRGAGMFLVALTGYGSREQKALALESGFDLHLVKPVSIDRLEALVAEIAARRS